MISIANGVVKYYGNPAGYVVEKQAVIDNIFRCGELEKFLADNYFEATYQDDIFDNLVRNNQITALQQVQTKKAVRIWQLKPNVDIGMKFISYEQSLLKFGEIDFKNYITVFDGKLNTENLEEIFEICNCNMPTNYTGHPMAISDLIELYDDKESQFFYVDRVGFKKIEKS